MASIDGGEKRRDLCIEYFFDFGDELLTAVKPAGKRFIGLQLFFNSGACCGSWVEVVRTIGQAGEVYETALRVCGKKPGQGLSVPDFGQNGIFIFVTAAGAVFAGCHPGL